MMAMLIAGLVTGYGFGNTWGDTSHQRDRWEEQTYKAVAVLETCAKKLKVAQGDKP